LIIRQILTACYSSAATILIGVASSSTVAATVPAEQRAVVQHGNGGPEVLSWDVVPVREPGAGQVLVLVYTAGVNPVDWKQRAGINGRRPGAPAFARSTSPVMRIPGSNIAGVDRLVPKPKNLSYARAVGLATANTAASALYRLQVRSGQKMVITGAAGGVGSSMAQLAKASGVYVIGTASARHTAFLKSIGVDEVIDYTQGDWTEEVNDVDFVFDTIGGTTGEKALGISKSGAKFHGIASENGEPEDEKCAAVGVECVPLRPSRSNERETRRSCPGKATLKARSFWLSTTPMQIGNRVTCY
jgi:NADPH:quinone reductase-like Zn-dependent oxidoreductase